MLPIRAVCVRTSHSSTNSYNHSVGKIFFSPSINVTHHITPPLGTNIILIIIIIIIIIYGIFKEISVPTTRIEHEKNVIMPNTVNIVYKNDKILF